MTSPVSDSLLRELEDRFLRYVQIDTTSDETASVVPSTPGQLMLGRLLAEELREIGAADVTLTDNGFVFGTIPATIQNTGETRPPVIAFLALSGGALFGAGQYVGLQYTTALNVSVMNSLGPVLIAGAAAILFRDKLAPVQMAGIAVSFAGVLVVVTRGDPNVLAHLGFNVGDLIIMGNMMLWAIYCCVLRFKPRMHWLSFIWTFSAIAGLASLPVHLWEHATGFPFRFDLVTLASVVYVAIFPSILAFLFWNRGVELIGANRAGAFLHLTPIYSAVLASALLGEHLQVYHLVGFALILAGVRFAAKKA